MNTWNFLAQLKWKFSKLPLRQHLVLVVCVIACLLISLQAISLRRSVAALEATLPAEHAGEAEYLQNHHSEIDETARLIAFFPKGDPTESFLKKAYGAASGSSIEINNVSLEPATTGLVGLNKKLIHMTITSKDDTYRQLIHDLLKTTPYLSLLRMSISRNDSGQFLADITWGEYSR